MYLSKNITGVGDYNCILRSWWEKVKPLAYISATEAPAEAFRTKAALIVNVGGGRYVFFSAGTAPHSRTKLQKPAKNHIQNFVKLNNAY